MAENQTHAQRFADALQRFESDGDIDRFFDTAAFVAGSPTEMP